MIQNRSIAQCVILSIVTCGIYAIYWYYVNLSDLYRANNMENKAGTDILLSILTCGIYTIYIRYQMGKYINGARIGLGLPEKDDAIVYLILTLFGLGIVVDIMVQSDLNDFIGPHYNNQFAQYYGDDQGQGGNWNATGGQGYQNPNTTQQTWNPTNPTATNNQTWTPAPPTPPTQPTPPQPTESPMWDPTTGQGYQVPQAPTTPQAPTAGTEPETPVEDNGYKAPEYRDFVQDFSAPRQVEIDTDEPTTSEDTSSDGDSSEEPKA